MADTPHGDPVQMINGKGFLSLDETAEWVGLSRRTVWRMCKDGRLPSTREGSRWLIPASALLEWQRRASMGGAA